MHYKNNGLSEESKINHDSIEKEFGLLSAKWRVYCDLFQNQKGANTLWEASELIYSVFIESLRDDFVITISRLTDNANTGKNGENKNSTLYRLRDDLKQLLKQRLREGYYNESLFVQKSRKEKACPEFKVLESKLKNLKIDIKALRFFRNKRKAHRDLTTIVDEHKSLKKSNAKDDFDPVIQKSIRTIEEILGHFKHIVDHETMLPGQVHKTPKGAEYFIKNLEEGNKWRKDEIERMTKKVNEST